MFSNKLLIYCNSVICAFKLNQYMYKSLKLNQRNIFDLIPGMSVKFSDGGPRGRVDKVAVFQRS